jgi:hypothetical protein
MPVNFSPSQDLLGKLCEVLGLGHDKSITRIIIDVEMEAVPSVAIYRLVDTREMEQVMAALPTFNELDTVFVDASPDPFS